MKTITATLDLYSMYGRILEDVEATITIKYNISKIIKAKKLCIKNCRIIEIRFKHADMKYLETYPFDIKRILKEILKEPDITKELIIEYLPAKELKEIEFIFE